MGRGKVTAKLKRAVSLKRAISRSLKQQGFEVRDGKILRQSSWDKAALRELHSVAVAHQIKEEQSRLRDKEADLIKFIANGSELVIDRIRPRLVEITKGTTESDLFKYLQLHWSIPVSNGYGRRQRFIVFDEANDKVMGILGLGDPVYSLRVRDQWIGWDQEQKRRNLYHVMDAYVLGAIPPYSNLLCAKLVALMVTCAEVQAAYRSKYKGSESLMNGTVRKPYLALVTSSSALGRSSLYNRLKLEGADVWHRLGFTSGSGDFHFANGLYAKIRSFAEDYCEPTAKAKEWGSGFRNRREVIGKCLTELGLSHALAYHQVSREVFAAPLSAISLRFLRGEVKRLTFSAHSADEIFDRFRERWMIPRAERNLEFRKFQRDEYRLWGN